MRSEDGVAEGGVDLLDARRLSGWEATAEPSDGSLRRRTPDLADRGGEVGSVRASDRRA